MSKKLIIFPFGGNAREALISIFEINRTKKEWDILGFVDDDNSTWDRSCCGVKVLGGKEVLKKFQNVQVLAVPGNPDNYLKRKDIIARLYVSDSRFATIIHPSVTLAADTKIGFNTLIMSNVVISCNVKIGNHCIILPNSVIAHDVSIGDYCCIGANVTISGGAVIDTGCFIGSGASLRDNIKVGEGCLIGLGSNVVSNVDSGVIVAGNPAREMRKVRQ